jgi:hypothetical protein
MAIGDLIEVYGSGRIVYQPTVGKTVLFKRFFTTTAGMEGIPQYPIYLSNGVNKVMCRQGITADALAGYVTMSTIASWQELKLFVSRMCYLETHVSETYFLFQGASYYESS